MRVDLARVDFERVDLERLNQIFKWTLPSLSAGRDLFSAKSYSLSTHTFLSQINKVSDKLY